MHALMSKIKIIVSDLKDDSEPDELPMRCSMSKTVMLIQELRGKFLKSGKYCEEVVDDVAEILENCSRCIGILRFRVPCTPWGGKVTQEVQRDFFEIMDVVLGELDNIICDGIPGRKNKSNFLSNFAEWLELRVEVEGQTKDLQLLEERRAWQQAKQREADDAARNLRSMIKQTKLQLCLALQENKEFGASIRVKNKGKADAMKLSSPEWVRSQDYDQGKLATEGNKQILASIKAIQFNIPALNKAESDTMERYTPKWRRALPEKWKPRKARMSKRKVPKVRVTWQRLFVFFRREVYTFRDDTDLPEPEMDKPLPQDDASPQVSMATSPDPIPKPVSKQTSVEDQKDVQDLLDRIDEPLAKGWVTPGTQVFAETNILPTTSPELRPNDSIRSSKDKFYTCRDDTDLPEPKMDKPLPQDDASPQVSMTTSPDPIPKPMSESISMYDSVNTSKYDQKDVQDLLGRINERLDKGQVTPRTQVSAKTNILPTTSPELRPKDSIRTSKDKFYIFHDDTHLPEPEIDKPLLQDDASPQVSMTTSPDPIPNPKSESISIHTSKYDQKDVQDLMGRINERLAKGQVTPRTQVSAKTNILPTTSPEPSPKDSIRSSEDKLHPRMADQDIQNLLDRIEKARALDKSLPSPKCHESHILPTTNPKPSPKSSVTDEHTQNMLDRINKALLSDSDESIPISEYETQTEVEDQEDVLDRIDEPLYQDTSSVLIPEIWDTDSMFVMDDSLGKTLREMRETLLRWCQEKIKPYGLPMYEFCESWKSGRALIALLHSFDEHLVDTRFLTKKSPRDTIAYGERVARSLGVFCSMSFVYVCMQKWPNQLLVMKFVMDLREAMLMIDELANKK